MSMSSRTSETHGLPSGSNDKSPVCQSAVSHVTKPATIRGSQAQLDTAVVAACPIPAGTKSRPIITGISLRRLLNSSPVCCVLKVTVTNGFLQLDTQPKAAICTWANLLRVASDCQDQNVCVCRVDPPGCFILETVRQLASGDELKVWFSTCLAAELQVPFLSPRNIQGNQAYVCHICNICFSSPNALKVHLMLDCQPFSVASSTYPQLLKQHPFVTQDLMRCTNDTLNQSASSHGMRLSVPVTPKLCHPSLQRAPNPTKYGDLKCCALTSGISESTKFQTTVNASTQERLVGTSTSRMSSVDVSDGMPQTVTFVEPTPSAFTQPYPSAVTFPSGQSLTSNMVRKPRGHVCLLCGKIYSRKYGLKIHLRTHTGHKPLRCKHCARPFSDPSNLNKHVRLHAEADSPYRCPHCRKVLVRRRDLERHIRSRHSNTEVHHGAGDSV